MKNIDFRVGDRVYHWKFGEGEILRFIDDINPVVVGFTGTTMYFKLDGRIFESEPPTLSFTPYDLINGGFSQERPKPDIKKGDLLYVKNIDSAWCMRYFSHWGVSGTVACFCNQRKDGEIFEWREYSIENPLENREQQND